MCLYPRECTRAHVCVYVWVCVSLHILSKYPGRDSGSRLIDWCWFHLGSEQRLTVDLSCCERQPLILVLFKQHVLIYVIFTKSAREERLPFYVWLFIEVGAGGGGGGGGGGGSGERRGGGGVPLYRPSMLPTRHLHHSGRVPERWDPTPRIKGCQGRRLHQCGQN